MGSERNATNHCSLDFWRHFLSYFKGFTYGCFNLNSEYELFFSEMKTIKPGLLCCFIAVTWNALLPEIHTQQFLPWKQDGKKLYLLYLSHHVIFYLLVYMHIYFILCTFLFCHFHWVHIWFSKELISLCGQKSDGFYPKLKVVFLYWQSVACKACYIGHFLKVSK